MMMMNNTFGKLGGQNFVWPLHIGGAKCFLAPPLLGGAMQFWGAQKKIFGASRRFFFLAPPTF